MTFTISSSAATTGWFTDGQLAFSCAAMMLVCHWGHESIFYLGTSCQKGLVVIQFVAQSNKQAQLKSATPFKRDRSYNCKSILFK